MLVTLVSFCSCSSASNNNKPQTNGLDIFIDQSNVESDELSVKISFSERTLSSGSKNRNLSVDVTFTNNSKEAKTILISNAKIVHKESEVEYNATVYPKKSIKLQYGIDNEFTFNATIPESIKDAEYILSFKADKEYRIHFYDTPEELRKDCIVKYVIGDTVVNTVVIKELTNIQSLYVWENKNHLTHCKEWYTDEDMKSKFKASTKIIDDITLYGKVADNVEYRKNASEFFIDGIAYVPADGILIIPDGGGYVKKSYIGTSAIYGNRNVREIYLPKNMTKIYTGNFKSMNGLKTIHFAGTKEEWADIQNWSAIPEDVRVVYNSKFESYN